MQEKKLTDGSYLVAPDGVNIHKDHLHLASDGRTILSHKVNGSHSYQYSGTRKSLSTLWEQITGESGRFPGGK
jgi:hypothetical protein